jgi:hypothetical protein
MCLFKFALVLLCSLAKQGYQWIIGTCVISGMQAVALLPIHLICVGDVGIGSA